VSLLKLTPESERLRRLAKAHAAGELSRLEFRRMRSEVIEGTATQSGTTSGDVTRRRAGVVADPSEPGLATSASAPALEDPRRHWRWIVAGMLALVALSIGIAQAHAATIPAARDRDPNPATSPRIVVDRVTLRNFTVPADAAIHEEDVASFLDARLAVLRAAAAPGAHGFTAAELDEIGRLLDAQGAHGGHRLDAGDAAQLSDLIASQQNRRGVSIVALEGLAAELSAFYRTRGYPLAVAYLPSQEVSGNEVMLEVQLGALEEVRLSGDSLYSAELLERAFEDQLGQPVTRKDAEFALYLINDLPGLDTRGSFAAGESVGGTRLDLDVRSERRFDGEIALDNHGDDATGTTRAVLHGDWYNPSRRGDALSGWLVTSFDPSNTVYGALEYGLPIGDLRTRLLARAEWDTFDWTDAGLDLQGDSATGSLGARRVLARSRSWSAAVDGFLSYQALELERVRGGELTDQRLAFGTIGYDVLRRFDESRSSLAGRISLDGGAILDGEFAGQSETLFRLVASGSAWRMVDLPGFTDAQRIGVRFEGQVASTAMPGTLQLGLGGPARVGAFDATTYSVDDGIVASVEARLRQWSPAFGDLLLFSDVGYGTRRRAFSSDSDAYLASAGVGWDVRLLDHLTAVLRASKPLASRDSDGTLDDDGYRIFWSVRYVP